MRYSKETPALKKLKQATRSNWSSLSKNVKRKKKIVNDNFKDMILMIILLAYLRVLLDFLSRGFRVLSYVGFWPSFYGEINPRVMRPILAPPGWELVYLD